MYKRTPCLLASPDSCALCRLCSCSLPFALLFWCWPCCSLVCFSVSLCLLVEIALDQYALYHTPTALTPPHPPSSPGCTNKKVFHVRATNSLGFPFHLISRPLLHVPLVRCVSSTLESALRAHAVRTFPPPAARGIFDRYLTLHDHEPS